MADMSTEKTQHEKLKDAARELETDDDENRFNEQLKQIAPKPKDDTLVPED